MKKFFLLSFLVCGLTNCFLFANDNLLLTTEKDTINHDPQYYFNQAMEVLKSAQTRSELKKAADLFEKAKTLSPEWNDVYYNLGLLYEKLDCYSQAVDNLVVSLRSCISSAKHDTDECEQIAIRLGKDQKKSEMLEKAKSLMVNGKWNLIRKIPDDASINIGLFNPNFSFDRESKMWMTNSYVSLLKDFKSMRDNNLIKENIKNHPRFLVNFDGRYFEIRQFYIWQITSVDDQSQHENQFFYPEYILFKGEIDFSSPQILVKVREYDLRFTDNPYLYTSYEKADEESFKNLNAVVFDEQKNFRVESQWKIE
jgi:tetratricopeptide (TPR) repeat protein